MFASFFNLKINAKFWANTFLDLLLPKGYGFHSTLKGKPSAKDVLKAKKTLNKANKLQWKINKDGIKSRNYSSEEDYRSHQSAKLDLIIGKGHGWKKKQILEYRLKFKSRFKELQSILDVNSKCLCLGARQGTEVLVLRELGFKNSIGIDLNPGPNNPLVNVGDFMNLEFPDNNFDFIYSNCLDHALNLDDFFREQVRVLKVTGLFIIDISTSEDAGHFESQEWERPEYVLIKSLKYFKNIKFLKREKRWFWVLISDPIKN